MQKKTKKAPQLSKKEQALYEQARKEHIASSKKCHDAQWKLLLTWAHTQCALWQAFQSHMWDNKGRKEYTKNMKNIEKVLKK